MEESETRDAPERSSRMSRRTALTAMGGVGLGTVGVVAGGAVLAGGAQGGTGTPVLAVAADGRRPACVLSPETTEGPYYLDYEMVRRDITEDRPGFPVILRAVLVDSTTCRPLPRAAVDIWHCDAGGVYSGFGQGSGSRTFMRGIQRTNAKGIATFRTVYPGWYAGRTVHIHVKVHLGGRVVHTGQLYFSDALTDVVYRKAPYSSRPGRGTRNATDSVFRNGGKRSLLRVRRSGAGYVGTIAMGVHRS
jgi:protocatechuate 3,4-dioxygenase beta subunit